MNKEPPLKSVHKAGECVSCGRCPGRSYRQCPYCGEQVWHPLWYRLGKGVVVFLPPLLSALLILPVCGPEWRSSLRALCQLHAVSGFMVATGVGVLILPPAMDGVIVSSRRELMLIQAEKVFVDCLMGVYAAICGCAWAWARENALAASPLILLQAVCVYFMPVFVRGSWRGLGAAALAGCALALR